MHFLWCRKVYYSDGDADRLCVITTGVRSTTGGYVFTDVCLLIQEGRYPSPRSLLPGPFLRGIPASGPMSFLGGTPASGPMSFLGVSQSWQVGTPVPARGYLSLGSCGQDRTGVPPAPQLGLGYPSAGTGYAAGGMPLAVSCERTFLLATIF